MALATAQALRIPEDPALRASYLKFMGYDAGQASVASASSRSLRPLDDIASTSSPSYHNGLRLPEDPELRAEYLRFMGDDSQKTRLNKSRDESRVVVPLDESRRRTPIKHNTPAGGGQGRLYFLTKYFGRKHPDVTLEQGLADSRAYDSRLDSRLSRAYRHVSQGYGPALSQVGGFRLPHIEIQDKKRLAFVAAAIVLFGVAGAVWYPRLFGESPPPPPPRPAAKAPPLFIEAPKPAPVPVRQAAPAIDYKAKYDESQGKLSGKDQQIARLRRELQVLQSKAAPGTARGELWEFLQSSDKNPAWYSLKNPELGLQKRLEEIGDNKYTTKYFITLMPNASPLAQSLGVDYVAKLADGTMLKASPNKPITYEVTQQTYDAVVKAKDNPIIDVSLGTYSGSGITRMVRGSLKNPVTKLTEAQPQVVKRQVSTADVIPFVPDPSKIVNPRL
ncbi:MAG: hypothetical protein Q8R04_02485 [Nanoarchaeota archaeon]|nr:hypothetical protein [Nanoarchaeota archaeon]